MQLNLLSRSDLFEVIRRLPAHEWWDRWEALPEAERPQTCLAVHCPKCKARDGVRCRRPSGHSGPMVGAHAERWDLVLAEAEARQPSIERGGKQ